MAESTNRCDEVLVDKRPWGGFEQFAHNEAVTVKIITVNPGQRLSLQTHARRDEMWQILDDPLDVQVDDRSWAAQSGERVWVPLGSRHRIANSGNVPGRLLEIAFGIFDEDDIVRFEDDYNR
ncbi:MAG: phosphomannose isomerase type II C-terminal cupin domain [Dermatophilaceae bacterium]